MSDQLGYLPHTRSKALTRVMTISTANEIGDPVFKPLKRDWIIIYAFIFYLVGAHLRISLHSGGEVVVPMFMMVFSALGMALWFLPALWTRSGIFITFLFSFLAIQPWLGMGVSNVETVIKNILQLTASIIGAASMLYAVKRADPNKIFRALIILWYIIILLALAEVYFAKGFFDNLREIIYSGSDRGLYFAVERDLDIYGRVRATALASEPSFLADTLSVLCIMVFLLSYKSEPRKAYLTLTVMLFVSIFVVPSFKFVFYIFALFIFLRWPKTGFQALLFFTATATFFLLFFFLFDYILGLMVFISSDHIETGSFFGRIGSAHIVGLNALSSYPLFGYGVGNRDSVYPIIVDVWNNSGAFILFPWYANAPAEGLLSNGFWWMLIYLGVLGTAFFLFLIGLILKGIGVQYPFRSITCAAITWYGGGGFVDPQSWCLVVAFSISAFPSGSRSFP